MHMHLFYCMVMNDSGSLAHFCFLFLFKVKSLNKMLLPITMKMCSKQAPHHFLIFYMAENVVPI